MVLKVSAVLLAWKEFDLHNAQQKIDETATDVTAKQDESDSSRKKLVELSKEFKRNVSDESRKLVSHLLKSFQAEVDNLTKRCKFAESAFLNVYKKIIDITDPIPSLEYCIALEKKLGKFADLEIENKNLRETLREYNEEFKEIRNQDVTIKSLKDKLKVYEENVNESILLKAKEMEKELQNQYSEKERLLQETQSSALRRLQEAESSSDSLRQMLEVTQSELFECRSRAEEYTAAHGAQTDMLATDLERTTQCLQQAEKEVTHLQEQLQQVAGDGQASSLSRDDIVDNMARAAMEVELTVKDREIVQLVEDVKKLQHTLHQAKMDANKKMQLVEKHLDEKIKIGADLKNVIDKQKDYEEIKRELTIIKSVEFGSENNISLDNEDGKQLSKPLELLLLEKNKSLQNENTVLKQANLELTRHISESNAEVSNLHSVCLEQKALIVQLESDLSSMQSFSSVYRGEGEGCPSMPEMVAEAVKASTLDTETSLTTRAADAVDGRDSDTSLYRPASVSISPMLGDAATHSAAESLLPIVSAQRERFKARNEELEAELASKNQQMILLQNEVDSLRNDNVQLYEKIRFLQSYRGQHNTGSGTTESRYVSQYEESLDPFASFSRKERLRRYGELSPFEKVTLSLGRFILSNKTARTVAFLYTMLVHCLVFLVLYKLAHTESCKRDLSSDCAQRFAEHMHDVHGDAEFKG